MNQHYSPNQYANAPVTGSLRDAPGRVRLGGFDGLDNPAADEYRAEAIKRQSVVEESICRLNFAVERAGGLLSDLSARLSPVLFPEPPVDKAAQCPSASVPVAQDIERAAERVEAMNRYMRSLIDRLGV